MIVFNNTFQKDVPRFACGLDLSFREHFLLKKLVF